MLCFPQPRTEGASMSLESITQAIRNEISKLNQVLHLLEGGAKKTKRARRKISAAGRKRIAAAQRAKWARIRASKK
jgi:exonuclease VII small subunit